MKCLVIFVLVAGTVGLQGDRRGGASPMDETPVNITVTQGSTAVLPCSVDPSYMKQNRDKYKVMWIKLPEQTFISLEDRRMTSDTRFSVERPFLRDWNLHIRNVSLMDVGEFMCRLNTRPVKSKIVLLLVNDKDVFPVEDSVSDVRPSVIVIFVITVLAAFL